MVTAVELYWPLAVAAAMAVVGYLVPQGAQLYHNTMPPLVAMLFVILGLTRDPSSWRTAGAAWHFHILLQSYSLLVTPVTYYFLVRSPGWDVTSGMLTKPLGVGCVVALSMPTTAATSLIFVQQCRADASVAAINMSLGQLSGAFVAPFVVALLLSHGDASFASFASTTSKMIVEIVLPMLGGIASRLLIHRMLPSAKRHLNKLSIANFVALAALFFLIFSKSFAESKSILSIALTSRLIAWVTAVHVLILACAALVARACRLERARLVAFVLPTGANHRVRPASTSSVLAAARCVLRAAAVVLLTIAHAVTAPHAVTEQVLVAPQKTEGLAVAILSAIQAELPRMDDDKPYPIAELTLPIIIYHSIQMVVASVLVPLIRLPNPAPATPAEREPADEARSRSSTAELPAAAEPNVT